jgi:UDP-N-acetylglucosamine--N-acetylmuramyl-(pentapeptide) pyrophosphoryl-undecaprenol N-acetylglucosamine transferase
MRIVVSGGGTAGHISPTLATCDALKSLDKEVELLYIGQSDSMEAKIVAARGMKFAAIRAGKFRRYHDARAVNKLLNITTLGPNMRDGLRAIAGVGGSISILRKFRPDVVFLKGGFVCVPVGIAAKILHIPYVVHESDVSPGLANRVLGRWATAIATGFPVKTYHDFPASRLVYTGNPVRNEVTHAHRLEGLAKFHLDDTLPVLFVTGGSAGARQINEVIVAALPELVTFCQVIHLAGESEIEHVKFEVSRLPKSPHLDRYQAYGFLMGEMSLALAAADLVVTRAGANTIAELGVLGKPTVLIPNYEMAGHQVENARVLSRVGAARVLDGSKLTTQKLVGELKRIFGDPEEQKRLGEAIRAFGNTDAAMSLARVILEAGGAGERAPLIQKPNIEDKS